jgi:hypothetical protein
VIEAFRAGTEANYNAPCRLKSIDAISVDDASPNTLIATGDLHDNPINFAKLVRRAGLDAGARSCAQWGFGQCQLEPAKCRQPNPWRQRNGQPGAAGDRADHAGSQCAHRLWRNAFGRFGLGELDLHCQQRQPELGR